MTFLHRKMIRTNHTAIRRGIKMIVITMMMIIKFILGQIIVFNFLAMSYIAMKLIDTFEKD